MCERLRQELTLHLDGVRLGVCAVQVLSRPAKGGTTTGWLVERVFGCAARRAEPEGEAPAITRRRPASEVIRGVAQKQVSVTFRCAVLWSFDVARRAAQEARVLCS